MIEWLILTNMALTLGLYWRTRRVIIMKKEGGLPHIWSTRKSSRKDRP